ncbi:type II secretion system protein [Paenibacillus sp. 2TAB26]|uniref:type II secretion system protein n=1 Tax=Paenibacillus sp. 2TAB26 TaxID=3233005 RepID=UPI003F9CDAD2
MQMLLKRFKKEEKGFTLIELLAVIVILAVIAVIAVPLIGNIISNTKAKSDLATARQVYDAARLYNVAVNAGEMKTVSIADLQTGNYLEKKIYLPSNKAEILGGTVTFTSGVLTSVTLATSAATLPTTVVSEATSTPADKFYDGTNVLKQ